MIIIIEGPDGAGKTSLARELQQNTGFKYEHHNKPEPDEDWYAACARQILTHGDSGLILDRSWISEIVYAPIVRPNLPKTPNVYFETLNILAKQHGALLIYCTSKPKTLWARCKSRGEDHITSFETLQDICKSYDEIYEEFDAFPKVKHVT